jgi:hypothetical protein
MACFFWQSRINGWQGSFASELAIGRKQAFAGKCFINSAVRPWSTKKACLLRKNSFPTKIGLGILYQWLIYYKFYALHSLPLTTNPAKGTELPSEPIRERNELLTFEGLKALIERKQDPIRGSFSRRLHIISLHTIEPSHISTKPMPVETSANVYKKTLKTALNYLKNHPI